MSNKQTLDALKKSLDHKGYKFIKEVKGGMINSGIFIYENNSKYFFLKYIKNDLIYNQMHNVRDSMVGIMADFHIQQALASVFTKTSPGDLNIRLKGGREENFKFYIIKALGKYNLIDGKAFLLPAAEGFIEEFKLINGDQEAKAIQDTAKDIGLCDLHPANYARNFTNNTLCIFDSMVRLNIKDLMSKAMDENCIKFIEKLISSITTIEEYFKKLNIKNHSYECYKIYLFLYNMHLLCVYKKKKNSFLDICEIYKLRIISSNTSDSRNLLDDIEKLHKTSFNFKNNVSVSRSTSRNL